MATTRKTSSYENRVREAQELRKALAASEGSGMSQERIIKVLAAAAKESPEAMKRLLDAHRLAIEENTTDLSAAVEKAVLQVQGAQGIAQLFDSDAAFEQIGKSELVQKKVASMDDIKKRAHKPRFHTGPGGSR